MGLNFDPIEEAGVNWRKHDWGNGRAMVAATSIARAHQLLLAEINGALAPFGLTFSRFEVLALLYFATDNSLPMGKIGSRLQVHPTSVTSLVDRLVADALVERVPHPTDRRTTLVTLTAAGAVLTPRCASALEEIDFGFVGLTASELDATAATITTFRRVSNDWVAPES